MKSKKLIALIALITSFAIIFTLASCSGLTPEKPDEQSTVPNETVQGDNTTAAEKAQRIKVGFLKGPTGMGAAYLMEQNASGKTKAEYTVSLEGSPDVFKASLIKGEIDIAALPVNVCAVLNKKTEGRVQLLAVNTLGTLYIMSNDENVKSVSDLKGRTVLSAGQGTTTEYVLLHILEKNGLKVGTDVKIEYASEHAEVITKASTGGYSVILLPEPFVTQMKLSGKSFGVAVDLTKEWKKLGEGELTMGAVAVRTDFAQENPTAVKQFLEDYKSSVDFAVANPDEASKLIEKHGIVAKAAVAKQALPGCNLTMMTGDEMKNNVKAYLKVLFEASPASVGGEMPEDSFYYGTK